MFLIKNQKKFISQNLKYEKFFKKIVDKKYIFDLRGFINREINSFQATFGKKNIFGTSLTLYNPAIF